MIYNFIWNDNQEKVKRETEYIDKYIEAIQINWVKKLTNKNFVCICIWYLCSSVYEIKTRKNCFRYLNLMSPLKKNYLTLRSNESHYGTRHTALWSCTHIPNIIDLSRKTKKLWSGQASLRRRRSGRRRKNQTKTICLPSFEGET